MTKDVKKNSVKLKSKFGLHSYVILQNFDIVELTLS